MGTISGPKASPQSRGEFESERFSNKPAASDPNMDTTTSNG